MRRRELLIGAATLALGACAPAIATTPSTAARPSGPFAGNPTLGIWPAFLSTAGVSIRDAYLFAAQHPNELRYIPCYCGCAGSGHTSNAECFVKSRAADGWMLLEPHGSQCGTCVGIALDVKAMLGGNVALREIRTAIDTKWSSAGPGTPTPLP